MPDDLLIEACIERAQRRLYGTPVVLDFKHTNRINTITLFWWAKLDENTTVDYWLDTNFNQLSMNPVELLEYNLDALVTQAQLSLLIYARTHASEQHQGVLATKAKALVR